MILYEKLKITRWCGRDNKISKSTSSVSSADESMKASKGLHADCLKVSKLLIDIKRFLFVTGVYVPLPYKFL